MIRAGIVPKPCEVKPAGGGGGGYDYSGDFLRLGGASWKKVRALGVRV